MFKGTIPLEVRQIIVDQTKNWDCKDIYIGCSGNYTIERVLQNKNYKLHSNDVSLYSSAIGFFLLGKDMTLAINDDCKTDFGWLNEYIKTMPGKLATIMISTNMLVGLDKNNKYYDRLREAYKEQWESIYKKTLKKLEGLNIKIDSYYPGDVIEYLDRANKDQGFISFPPFYKGGYEKLYENMEKIFVWDKPEYKMFDEKRLELFIEKVKEKKHWLFATDHEIKSLKEFWVGRVKRNNLSKEFYIYTKGEKSYCVQPKQKTKNVFLPRLGINEDIGSRLVLKKLPQDIFNSLRSYYLNPHIMQANAKIDIGVFADEKLIGCFALGTDIIFGDIACLKRPYMYLMTDFCVYPTKYKYLSKLILYAVLSKEVRIISENLEGRRQNAVITTAFTRKKESMKYRGILKLLKRTPVKNEYYKYKVTYGAYMGQWTLEEGFKLWREKYENK